MYVDRTLLAHPIVYAAAGTANTVFGVAPDALVRAAYGTIGDVAEEPPAGVDCAAPRRVL